MTLTGIVVTRMAGRTPYVVAQAATSGLTPLRVMSMAQRGEVGPVDRRTTSTLCQDPELGHITQEVRRRWVEDDGEKNLTVSTHRHTPGRRGPRRRPEIKAGDGVGPTTIRTTTVGRRREQPHRVLLPTFAAWRHGRHASTLGLVSRPPAIFSGYDTAEPPHRHTTHPGAPRPRSTPTAPAGPSAAPRASGRRRPDHAASTTSAAVDRRGPHRYDQRRGRRNFSAPGERLLEPDPVRHHRNLDRFHQRPAAYHPCAAAPARSGARSRAAGASSPWRRRRSGTRHARDSSRHIKTWTLLQISHMTHKATTARCGSWARATTSVSPRLPGHQGGRGRVRTLLDSSTPGEDTRRPTDGAIAVRSMDRSGGGGMVEVARLGGRRSARRACARHTPDPAASGSSTTGAGRSTDLPESRSAPPSR